MTLFDRGYEVLLADTEASRVIHRKIRYHVYCLERRFENPADFPSGEEHDQWDSHAAQFIVRSRRSGAWVAAMRLILPHADSSFPVEALRCLKPARAADPNRRALAEISRICLIRSLNPQEINRHLDRNFGHAGKNGESEVLLGMIRAIVIHGLERGIEQCYLLMTDASTRLLRRLGVVLHPVGAAIDHRGVRVPYRVGLRENVASLAKRSAAMRDLFTRKTLAYRLFSRLDQEVDEEIGPTPWLSPALPVDARPHMEDIGSRPDLSVWRMEAERSKPGPGTWRGGVAG